MGENFWGFGGLGKIWKGFGGILTGGMISGEHWDCFLFFEKGKCLAMLVKPTQSHVKHGRGHLHGAYHFFVLEPVCKVVMCILMITRSLRRPEKQ